MSATRIGPIIWKRTAISLVLVLVVVGIRSMTRKLAEERAAPHGLPTRQPPCV